MQSNHGFSLNQLVYWKNPNLPNVLENKPLVLENVTINELVANKLNAVHAARKGFVETEASQNLARAILRKVRLSTILSFQLEDKLYFRRQDSDRWGSPVEILGIEKHQIFVKHGGTYVRFNPCHIRHERWASW